MNRIQFRLRTLVLCSTLVVIVGTIGLMLIEDLSLGDAFYFCIVTITTVGYGDIHPLTMPGKIFSACLIVVGVGTFLALIANAAKGLLERNARTIRLAKLDMVIGVFYSELGTELIIVFAKTDPDVEGIRSLFVEETEWTKRYFTRVRKGLRKHKFQVEIDNADLIGLSGLFRQNRDFLVRLIENQTLLQYEYFTNLLWALFHLNEELHLRGDFHDLSDTDLSHLAEDMNRAYVLLVFQWLLYMEHLKANYPYMFSLAMRRNPFNLGASPFVT